mmetsp:Transcript_31739/g.66767  ORF Transcript_31739/g.66767 Transcript_31739/m.66767 type:complete len:131 (-) Transcript_31739:346-738(-)|eukprot:CAMPEP_0172309482 /NCGR_PEP_ID=MMETSP1058-20130122/9750_1 /TAXON_ID=83371 /ORGANISM="Detonula confervacea, Strain CCMP 353" /LENGTH=130 /DNA_ID=CAMNT_0013022111 /DNA_START=95 /DNA_END=487 /DNA_ORIENTATION=+
MMSQRMTTTILFCLMALLSSALAFVPSANFATTTTLATPLKAAPLPAEFLTAADTTSFLTAATTTTASESSSNLVSVATLDPTTMLSDTLGGLLGSYAILAVPIIAALAIVGVIAFGIISYANPADEDDL